VELVQPKRVLTLHGFAAEFARDLRDRGVEAWALTEANQLELRLTSSPPKSLDAVVGSNIESSPSAPPASSPTAAAEAFIRFADTGEAIGQTTSKLRKVELLANYLRSLDGVSLPLAAVYLMGRAFPPSDQRVLQTGWAIIWRALLAVTGVSEQRLRQIGATYADAGRTAFDVLQHKTSDGSWTLAESGAFFGALAEARGPVQKGALLQERLAALGALESSYVVRILTGDLRIGLKEGLVEEAIAKAFEAEADDVREAHMLTGDLGQVAVLAARRGLQLADVHLFRPVKCMLASPEPDVEAIWSRLENGNGEISDGPFWAEDKFDGIRAHLHIGVGRVEIYSRDLRQITVQFADLARAARAMDHRVILDGEILAFAEGRALTFFDLQKRLGRRNRGRSLPRSERCPGGLPRIRRTLAERHFTAARTPLGTTRTPRELAPAPRT
jgi:DNA ligase-1